MFSQTGTCGPLGDGRWGEASQRSSPANRHNQSSVFSSIEVENELESNLRSLHANYAGVSTTLRDENLHAIDVPFIVPSPSELLMDVLASKAPVGIPTLSSDVTGTIALLVCTDDQGAISAISTKVSIGSMRNVSITMQELYDCGLLLTPEREPSLCLLTVVSRVWRSLGCVESPQKAKLREKQRKEKEGRISRPPVIKRAEVATFVQDRGPGAAERDITDKDVADCLVRTRSFDTVFLFDCLSVDPHSFLPVFLAINSLPLALNPSSLLARQTGWRGWQTRDWPFPVRRTQTRSLPRR